MSKILQKVNPTVHQKKFQKNSSKSLSKTQQKISPKKLSKNLSNNSSKNRQKISSISWTHHYTIGTKVTQKLKNSKKA